MLSSSTTSSPDPLALSYDGQLDITASPLKAGSPSSTAPVKSIPRPIRETSPNTQASPIKQIKLIGQVNRKRQEQKGSFTFSTPTKGEKVDGERSSSPWKIRVTVEAGPEEMEDAGGNGGSAKRSSNPAKPTVYEHIGRTITIKVPLKGADEHSPVKRRGRPRKSDVTPRKELGSIWTPQNSRISGKRKSAIGSEDNNDAMPQLDGAGSDKVERPLKKARGRPRKSDGKSPSCVSPKPLPEAQTRSMAINFATITPLHQKAENARLLDTPDIMISGWVGPGKNNNLKPTKGRVPTPRKPIGWEEQDDEGTHNFTSSPEVRTDEVKGMLEEDRFLAAETAAEDDTSVLNRSAVESEGFSIVSLESLRYQKEVGYPGDHGSGPTTDTPEGLIQKRECMQNDCTTAEQNIQAAQHTRCHHYSSPSLPQASPSSAKVLSPIKKIVPVVEAGVALQRVFGNWPHQQLKRASPRCASPPCQPPTPDPKYQLQSLERSKAGALFGGFGDGTRRNLQANFMKGELLARGQRGFLSNVTSSDSSRASEKQPCILETGMHHRLPTPADSVDASDSAGLGEQIEPNSRMAQSQQSQVLIKSYDEMSWQPTRAEPLRGSVESYNRMSWRETTPPGIPDGTFGLEQSELNRTEILQRQYQRDREDVNRQIEEANTSQVIVIDSSEIAPAREDEEEQDITMLHADGTEVRGVDSDNDIWREEADRAMEHSKAKRSKEIKAEKSKQVNRELQENTPKLNNLFVEDFRPPRAKIPRTWRRTSNADFLYSDEAEDEHSRMKPLAEQLNDRFTRDGKYPIDTPSNFLRNQPPVEDASRERKKSPSKGILSSPQHPRSSPPKEVRFAKGSHYEDAHAASHTNLIHEDQAYFSDSSDEHRDEDNEETFLGRSTTSSSNEAIDATFVIDNRSSFASDRINKPHLQIFELDTSDVRQLKRELHGLAGESSLTANSVAVVTEISQNNISSILKPKKTYAPLFPSQDVTSLQMKPLPPSPQKLHKHSPVRIEATESAKSVPAPSLLTRLTSWLFPSHASERISVNNTSQQLLWTRNHYLLLDYIYRLPLSSTTHAQAHVHNHQLPSFQTRLTTAYYSPLPPTLQEFIGHTFTTNPDHDETNNEHRNHEHVLQLTARHIRIAHTFILEAKHEGVPWLCDGAFFSDGDGEKRESNAKRKRVEFEDEDGEDEERKGTENEEKYPLRGADGRIVRKKEEWGAREVCLRVFSLWVGDSVRAGGVRVS